MSRSTFEQTAASKGLSKEYKLGMADSFAHSARQDDVCKVRCPLPVELQEALKQIDLDKDLTENYRKRCRKSRVMDRDDVIDKSCQQTRHELCFWFNPCSHLILFLVVVFFSAILTRKYLNIPGLIDYDFWREQHN